ncbi:MAG: adenosylcobalamin-dependent ribonucleoside-diphosphate reductase [Nanoarchaeota archaeon]
MITGQAFEVMNIRKRDGSIAPFELNKITNAIYGAATEVGQKSVKLAKALSDNVVSEVAKRFKDKVPSVEEIQDIVEEVLMREGHPKIAKAYILYRERRAELRKEKAVVLEKEEIDEVDKVFDINALRVLKSRYLRKDDKRKLIETPKPLFTRIATHITLPDVIYDERMYDIDGKQKIHPDEEFNPEEFHNKVRIGNYFLNQYHLEALKRMYDRMNHWHQIKLSWSTFFSMIKNNEFEEYENNLKEFYNLMVSRRFMPNTPAIANFGAVLGMGSACFVLGIDDSMESIMETLRNAAIIFKSGGGVGYNFSHLRNEGDVVSTSCGVASGPISFMTMFDKMTEVIKQGGIRRGANMGILNGNHPDIEKFIKAKEGNKQLRNFNISVLIMPDFWEHYNQKKPYPLRNPRTGQVVKTVDPEKLFDEIVYQAWESAEPGVIFFDYVNKFNPFFDYLGPIVTTNPCGEVLLYPNESCNLGSINVWSFLKEDDDGNSAYDWEALKENVKLATRFLDNIIDVSKHPLPQIEEMTLATRKIGLGVMGLGDAMYELRLPYNSDEGRKFMGKLMQFINYYSKVESIELAKTRGKLPYFDKSFYKDGKLPFAGADDKKSWDFDWGKISEDIKKYGIRNGYTTIIAPTGSISMIAGCSSGIEPVYSLVFEKNVKVGSFYYTNHVFEKVMKQEGLYDEKLMADICKHGGRVSDIPWVPKDLKEIFVTAMDTVPEDHIRALATFQKWVDSSISKTCNFPANATVEYMKKCYLLAYELGCKDVTVFRDSSIQDQVLVVPKKKNNGELSERSQLIAATGSSPFQSSEDGLKECPECKSYLVNKEGCLSCTSCGWGLCK